MATTPQPLLTATFSALVVDDDPLLCQLLCRVVKEIGGKPVSSLSASAALSELSSNPPDILILDNRLPDGSGVSIFWELVRAGQPPTTILLTGFPDLDEAVKLTQHGLFHYLQKPFHPEDFRRLLVQAQQHLKFRHPAARLPDLYGESPLMVELRRKVSQAANYPEAYVLVHGETGVGKELVAQVIHNQTSFCDSSNSQFVAIDCSSLPGDLIEAELFGSEKGAYTGAHKAREGLLEAANQGTLFLDEIGDMPLAQQTRLLRFLETREFRRVGSNKINSFSGRVIAATNRDLKECIKAGTFRQDLYYRLEVLSLQVPPLRERSEDIAGLAHNLLARLCDKYKRSKPYIRTADLEALTNYDYPGNVRELRNLIERALLQTPANSGWLDMYHVIPVLVKKESILPLGPHSSCNGNTTRLLPLLQENGTGNVMRDAEYLLLKEAMTAEAGVISRVARKLGLSRQSVLRRLEKWPDIRR